MMAQDRVTSQRGHDQIRKRRLTTLCFVATRVAAIRGLLDRGYGKSAQSVEAQVQVGISTELERILQDVDGQSRSVPARANGTFLLTASQRHRELWPDHAGRLVRFEHRWVSRTAVAEMFAVHTRDEIQAVLDRIEAKGRGMPIGEQMLADAHRRDAENDRHNFRD